METEKQCVSRGGGMGGGGGRKGGRGGVEGEGWKGEGRGRGRGGQLGFSESSMWSSKRASENFW